MKLYIPLKNVDLIEKSGTLKSNFPFLCKKLQRLAILTLKNVNFINLKT